MPRSLARPAATASPRRRAVRLAVAPTPLLLLASLALLQACGARAVRPERTEPLPELLDAGGSGDGASTPRPVPGPGGDPTRVVSLALSGAHSCALMGDGSVRCWGLNCNGALGFTSSTRCPSNGGDFPACGALPTCELAPTEVPGLAPVAQLTPLCAAMADGTVRCLMPVQGVRGFSPVPGLADVVEVSASNQYGCALHRDGGVSCWSMLGTTRDGGAFRMPFPPERIQGVSGAVGVSASSQSGCARLADRSVRCWGLGGGFEPAAPRAEVAVAVPELDRAASVAAGTGFTCALQITGQVRCLGLFPPGESTLVEGLDDALELAIGFQAVCARTLRGTVSCAGPDATRASGPNRWRVTREVPGLSDAEHIAASSGSFCALRRGGQVSCWGLCLWNQCGDRSFERWRDQPVVVSF